MYIIYIHINNTAGRISPPLPDKPTLLSYANGETPPQIPYSVERWRGGRFEGGGEEIKI